MKALTCRTWTISRPWPSRHTAAISITPLCRAEGAYDTTGAESGGWDPGVGGPTVAATAVVSKLLALALECLPAAGYAAYHIVVIPDTRVASVLASEICHSHFVWGGEPMMRYIRTVSLAASAVGLGVLNASSAFAFLP